MIIALFDGIVNNTIIDNRGCMRFILLFLIFTISVHSTLFTTNESPVKQGIVAQTKQVINKVIHWGKVGCKYIFTQTAEPQYWLIAPHVIGGLLIDACIYDGMQHIEATHPSVPLDVLPEGIQSALTKLNAQNIPIKIVDGDNGSATISKTIWIGKDLLSSSNETQRFIAGHEIAHIQQHHIAKTLALHALCLGSLFCTKKIVHKIEKILETMDTNTYSYTTLFYIKYMLSFIVNNPFITYILLKTLFAYFSRYCEKQADISAATTLNCAQGGIDYFSASLLKEQEENIATEEDAQGSSLLDAYCRFFSFFSHHLNWSSHPAHEERIEYLLPLARQQAMG